MFPLDFRSEFPADGQEESSATVFATGAIGRRCTPMATCHLTSFRSSRVRWGPLRFKQEVDG
jgi:hypothetical protein